MEGKEGTPTSGRPPLGGNKGGQAGAAGQTPEAQSRPRELVVRTRKYQDDGGDLSDDSDLRSSPARGAALALASMNRQKPEYAFPLKDDGNVEVTPEANGKGGRGAAARRGDEDFDEEGEEEEEEEEESGAKGPGRKKRKSTKGFYGESQPQPFRKKDRKSAPFSSPSSDQIQAMWGKRQAIADPLVPVRSMPVEIAISEPVPGSSSVYPGDSVPMSVYPGSSSAAAPAPAFLAPPKSSMGPPADKPAVAAATKTREDPGPPMGVIFPHPHVQAFGSPEEQYEGLSAVGAVRFDRPYVPGPPPQAHPQSQGNAYNRKDKSLGLLCENFIRRFSDPNLQDPDVGISLDKAANTLGVEWRRIYENIKKMVSISDVSRKCKNTYSWHGHIFLEDVLKLLQDEALTMWPEDAVRNGLAVPPDHSSRTAAPTRQTTPWPGQGAVGPSLPDPNAAMADERKEKSLGRLSQKFIQLFLIGYQVISLAGAAEKLLGAVPGPQGTLNDRGMKTKVRRLYDIANVLTSLRLIDKIQVADSRKPSFRWVGVLPQTLLARPSPKVDMPGNIFPGVPGLTVSAKAAAFPQGPALLGSGEGGALAPVLTEGGPQPQPQPQPQQPEGPAGAMGVGVGVGVGGPLGGYPGPEAMFPAVPGGFPPYAAGAPPPPFAQVPPGAFMYQGSESVYPHWAPPQDGQVPLPAPGQAAEGSQSSTATTTAASSQETMGGATPSEAAPTSSVVVEAGAGAGGSVGSTAPAAEGEAGVEPMAVDLQPKPKPTVAGEARGEGGAHEMAESAVAVGLGMGKDKAVGTEWDTHALAVGSMVQ